MTLKMHDITAAIKTDNDDLTIHEIFEYFESLLLANSFPAELIKKYYTEKIEEIL